jgi:hypothetical protein
MNDKEFFIKAFLQVLPKFADASNEDVAIGRASALARQATGEAHKLGVLEGDVTLMPSGMPLAVASAADMAAMAAQAPTGFRPNQGNLVSTSPIQKAITVGPVT